MIGVEVVGGAELSAALGVVAGRLSDLRVPLGVSNSIIADALDASFAAGGLPDAWAPIGERARRSRIRDGGDPDAPPLTSTGDLRRVVTSMAPEIEVSHVRGNREITRSASTAITADSLVKTVSGPDVRAHQMGYPENNLPARPFFVVAPDTAAGIVAAHDAWVNEIVGSL